MRKLRYSSGYLKQLLKALKDIDVNVVSNPEDIIIEVKNKEDVSNVLHALEEAASPLTYQINHNDNTVTLFDPRI